jgi:hypothetical protein
MPGCRATSPSPAGCSHPTTTDWWAACPENRSLLGWHEPGAEFTEEGTALLLEGPARQDLLVALRAKVERWDPEQWYDSLPRNLRAVVQAA